MTEERGGYIYCPQQGFGLQPRTRGGDRGRYYLLYEEERKIFAKNIFSVRRICHHSDFFIS